jgi:succinate dehydrogenase/fumarate reductase flavoprotein subunit
MSAKARQEGIPIRTGMRVTKILQDENRPRHRRRAMDELDVTVRLRARKAVIFATGGYTHNPELARASSTARSTAAAPRTPTKAILFVLPARSGVQLRNMNHAWNCPIPLEKSIAKDGSMSGMFSVAGDSMLFVNKYGIRKRQ